MENQNITHLLSQISGICRKYEEIAEITGENFNVFKVLGLTTNEVRTHSAFLAELLNPKGSHGCKDAFLKLFVEEFNIKEFNTENAITQVEKHIGFINDKYTEGGYIDIIITSKDNHAIIIENKIYAGDQYKQLYRYQNYGAKSLNNFKLIYLTLDGIEPTDESKGTLTKEDYLCISYRDGIINWLERCKKEAVSKPLVRETITQYINLIKRLTNQTINNKMSKEIVEQILESKSNFDAYTIANSKSVFDALFSEVFEKKTIPIIEKVLDYFQIKNDFEDFKEKFNKKEKGLQFNLYTEYLSAINLKITFMFQAKDYNNFSFGYSKIDKNKSENFENEYNKITKKFIQQNTNTTLNYGTHICFSYFENYVNWIKFKTIKQMCFEQNPIPPNEELKTKFEIDLTQVLNFLINECLNTNNENT